MLRLAASCSRGFADHAAKVPAPGFPQSMHRKWRSFVDRTRGGVSCIPSPSSTFVSEKCDKAHRLENDSGNLQLHVHIGVVKATQECWGKCQRRLRGNLPGY